MSSSAQAGQGFFPIINALFYRDVAAAAAVAEAKAADISSAAGRHEQEAPGPSLQEIEAMVNVARADAVGATEDRLQKEFDARLAEQAARVSQAIALFHEDQKTYFSRVESDVVHLALAIAAKILHREAHVDPLLIAALVRLTIEKLHDASKVNVRVCQAEAEMWRAHMVKPLNGAVIEIIEDSNLGAGDCVLTTDLGSTNFGVDAQLKEVEQGFFDLLAQRPAIK